MRTYHNNPFVYLYAILLLIFGGRNALAQLQVQKLEFDLDKDGITDAVWFDIDKGRLEVLLSTQANQSVHTPVLFDPLKIYSYKLISEKQNFRLYVMRLPLITDAHFYYDEKQKRIRLSKIVIDNRNNPPGHGYKVITTIDLLAGKFTKKRTVYQTSTDEFIDEIYTGTGSFQPIYLEEYEMTTAKELLDSLIFDE